MAKLQVNFGSDEFRKELNKIMPGYKWTVHKSSSETTLYATGSQSRGFNRLSTLCVERSDRNGVVSYSAKSAGFGLRARWLSNYQGKTLAQALRGLQNHYENVSQNYRTHAEALERGRNEPS